MRCALDCQFMVPEEVLRKPKERALLLCNNSVLDVHLNEMLKKIYHNYRDLWLITQGWSE